MAEEGTETSDEAAGMDPPVVSEGEAAALVEADCCLPG